LVAAKIETIKSNSIFLKMTPMAAGNTIAQQYASNVKKQTIVLVYKDV